MKVGPTSLTMTGTESWRDRRAAGEGEGRWAGLARRVLRMDDSERNESLVARGSARYCWARKASKPGTSAEELPIKRW